MSTGTLVPLAPIDNRVCIIPDKAPESTEGGIVLPQKVQEDMAPQRGVIAAVGPGRVLDSGVRLEPQVKVGNIVLYRHFAGTTIEHDGQDVLIMEETEILAVVAG